MPDALSVPNYLPANFRNANSPCGVVFSTPGTGFQVSASAATPTPVEFGNINASYPRLFKTFSPQRLFTALGSNVIDVNVSVPGPATPAFTTGFGAVFSDVDLANATSLQFFDLANASLATLFAPSITGNETLSFVGGLFNAGEQVGRVRITSGNDDFVYAEPRAITAVPEQSSLGLFVVGVLPIWGFRRRSAQHVSFRRAVRPRQ